MPKKNDYIKIRCASLIHETEEHETPVILTHDSAEGFAAIEAMGWQQDGDTWKCPTCAGKND